MTSVYNRRHPTTDSSTTAVRYTPCAKGEQTDEEELEEIAVVSRDTLSVADENEQSGSATANGPRVLPSPTLYHTPSDRTKLIGERLSAAGKISVSSPVYSGRVVEQKSRSTSKTSLLEVVSQKLDRVRGRKTSSHHSKEEVAFINKAAHLNDVMTPREIRKARRKEIQEKFGKRRGTKFEKVETSTTSSDRDSCKWTFVFDPSGRLAYWWSLVISMAFVYNFWVIIYRFAFDEICAENMALWFTCDYLADLLYILDIAFHFRTGYLEDGVLQTDSTKLRLHYLNSTMFYIDCLCLLPLDFLYLSIGFKSMLRCFRLVKIYRFWTFLDRTERHTNYPNVVRTVTLLHYLFAIYHWNACLIHLGYKHALDKYTTDGNMGVFSSYLNSLYWSTLTLTTIGELPTPTTKGEIMFVILEFVFGLLLFSTILGHVANIVTSISAARKDFQAKLDIVKTYMSLRRVPLRLQDRVIRWFDYLWMSKKSWDEEKALCLLPDKLKAEIALHVHLDTLRRVEIFQNTEAGFLCELVLKLRPVLFSPGDYICRKGEVGKEMYIVNRGRLQVVADNGKTVLATLRPGSYFGEISILNMGNEGNRRTASVRSVGYSDLFCLSKNDLWEVLKEYPAARVRLEAIAVKRLEKYKKAPLEKASISRSKSTPGLIESTGKVPLEIMQFHRHHTLPASLITSKSSSRGSHGSLDSRALGSDGSAPSRRTTSNDSHTCQTTMGESVSAVTGPDQIDNSHTVSSITSFADDGSLQKSSMMTTSTQSAFSPPLSPNVTLSSTVPAPSVQVFSSSSAPQRQTFSFQKPSTSGLGHSSRGPSVTSALTRPRTNVTSGPGSAQGKGTLPALPPPPSCTTTALSLPPMSASQSMLILSAPPSNIPPSSSLGSLTRDPSNDILLQEIQRLRERLVQLETENASMSLKLNQQQWEVEHRLAEIEMHICGSDSAASQASDERPIVNRESII